MRRLRLIKINPVTAFKAGLGVGSVVGAIAAVIYIFINLINGISGHGVLGGVGRGFLGIFIGVFLGILYAIGTSLFCWLNALIYNVISRQFGPLEVEIRGD